MLLRNQEANYFFRKNPASRNEAGFGCLKEEKRRRLLNSDFRPT